MAYIFSHSFRRSGRLYCPTHHIPVCSKLSATPGTTIEDTLRRSWTAFVAIISDSCRRGIVLRARVGELWGVGGAVEVLVVTVGNNISTVDCRCDSLHHTLMSIRAPERNRGCTYRTFSCLLGFIRMTALILKLDPSLYNKLTACASRRSPCRLFTVSLFSSHNLSSS